MAKLIIFDKEYDVPDGDLIAEACMDAGVSFNCNSGICGSCLVKVVEGAENLGELTEEEKDLDLDENNRLACVCVIKGGIVKVTF